jgi:hypothetical protein
MPRGGADAPMSDLDRELIRSYQRSVVRAKTEQLQNDPENLPRTQK